MTSPEEQRRTLTGPGGEAVLTYVRDTRDGRPWADLAEPLVPDPVPAVLDAFSGWAFSGPVDLGERLLRHGARPLRHAHTMSLDLTAAAPLPAAWRDAALPGGLRRTACDRPAAELLPAYRAAFSAEHPDHEPVTDRHLLDHRLLPLLDGTALGPVLPCSALAVDGAGRPAAGIIVADRDGLPWVASVFRDPDPRYAGAGAALMRHALTEAAAGGATEVGLAVTEANPARALYEKLGFVVLRTSLTVLVP
ncbi:GNAT family N-acetyltransferase [Streptomyces sp. NPDC097619]|uniref:GNAT family N-acetyltransferase n=1 Tax=Streptomyces sp. NPDC097619 TaxID=3157228 RepID=UPI003318E41A